MDKTDRFNRSISDNRLKSAFRIAELHLRKFARHLGKNTRRIGTIQPFWEPFRNDARVFEVALIDDDGNKNGYLWVALMSELPPVPMFALSGRSAYEHLRRKARGQDFIPVVYSFSYFVAESPEGEYIAAHGQRPAPPEPGKGPTRAFDYTVFKKCFREYRTKKLEALKGIASHKWERILKRNPDSPADASASDYIVPADVPDHDFQVVTADYPEYLLRCSQIPGGAGANSAHNFWSGCTSTAWMTLIGYHNNVYTHDVLRGTHYSRGPDSNYISRVLVQLSEHLGTSGTKDGEGSVSPSDIHKGFGFITDVLGCNITNRKRMESGGIPALQVVYDYLCMYGVPSVISIPGHTLIGYEVLADRNDDRGDHYLKVYQGWDAASGDSHTSNAGQISSDPYICYELLDDGAWTFQQLDTSHDIRVGFQSIATPATIELGDPKYPTELVIAIRMTDEDIGLLYSMDGRNYSLRYKIAATGTSPPALAVQGYRNDPYVAWVEADGGLKLAQVSPKTNRISELPAPPDLSYSKVGPAIHTLGDKLFYVWDTNIAYTRISNFERSAVPWPTEVGYDTFRDAYLGSLGLVAPAFAPSLTADGNRLYLGYCQTGTGGGSFMLVIGVHARGYLSFFMDSTGSNRHRGEPRLRYWGKTLYGTMDGPISEVSTTLNPSVTVETKYYPYGVEGNLVNLGVFSGYEIGPSLFTLYFKGGDLYVRFHSIDNSLFALDYTGWP